MPGRGRPPVLVGSTGNRPELIETIPITTEPRQETRVALSFGPAANTELPFPDLRPGDRLEVFAELAVTTDADDPRHPGLVGRAYSYAPEVRAELLLAAGPDQTRAQPGLGLELARPWQAPLSHEQHHGVITFDGGLEVLGSGLPWRGDSS